MNENVKMSKGKAVLFAITVWITSFTVMWQMSEVVIVNDLYGAFPDGAGLITAILSWPALLTALASLAAGKWLEKVSTKLELIVAGVLMLFGIAAPMGSNIYWLTVCSFIMAIGAGFANTAGMSIISEVFIDEKKRASQMGYYNAVMSACGVAITFLAGLLAVNGWQLAFSVNWFTVPMLIMTVLFLPNIKPQDRIVEDMGDMGEEGTKKGFTSKFWIYFASMFLFFMSYSCFFTYVSVYVAENNLGSTAFVGTISSLTTVGSFVAALIFGAMYGKLRRKLSLVYIILPIIGYVWTFMAPSAAAAIVMSLIYGFCYGGVFTMVYAYAAQLVSPASIGTAMGLMTFNYSVAIVTGVNIFSVLMGKTGTITATYPYAIGILVVALVIEIISCVKEK